LSLLQILLSLLDYKARLLLWIAGSVALYALAVNFLDYSRPGLSRARTGRSPHTRLSRLVTRLDSWPYRFWLDQIFRFAYYVGLPFLALIKGVMSPRLLGLSDLDWIGGIGAGVPLGLGAFLLLVWGWSHYIRSLGRRKVERPRSAEAHILSQPWGWLLILLEIIYLEAHWAFYRSGPLAVLGDYWGVFAGLGVVFVEWATNPTLRRNLGRERQGEILWNGSLALVIAILFLFTRNLWLCAIIHLGLEIGLLAILGALYRKRGARIA
jgi:hypothetical protein